MITFVYDLANFWSKAQLVDRCISKNKNGNTNNQKEMF